MYSNIFKFGIYFKLFTSRSLTLNILKRTNYTQSISRAYQNKLYLTLVNVGCNLNISSMSIFYHNYRFDFIFYAFLPMRGVYKYIVFLKI